MTVSDQMTRSLTAIATTGQAVVSFEEGFPLMSGEWVTDGTTVYQVSSSARSSATMTGNISVQLGVGTVLTRYDKYGMMSSQEMMDYFSSGDEVFLYKLGIQARNIIENELGSQPLVSRSFDETYSYEKEKLRLRPYLIAQGLQPPPPMSSYYGGGVYSWDWSLMGQSSGINTLIILRKKPVISITSLTIDGTAADSSNYSVNTDTGELYYQTGYTFGWQNIEVVYTAGYSLVPFEFRQIFIDLVQLLFEASHKGRNVFVVQNQSGAGQTSLNFQYRTMKEMREFINDRIKPFSRFGRKPI